MGDFCSFISAEQIAHMTLISVVLGEFKELSSKVFLKGS
jgi:hypothetical protein